MTHSIHREGPLDLLNQEYVLFVYPARGFNYDGSGPKVRRLGEMLFHQGPANLLVLSLRQNMYSGVPQEEILNSIKDGAKIFSVLEGREKLKDTLAKIKEMDEGISIVVTGNIDRVRAGGSRGRPRSPYHQPLPRESTGGPTDSHLRISASSPPCAAMAWSLPA